MAPNPLTTVRSGGPMPVLGGPRQHPRYAIADAAYVVIDGCRRLAAILRYTELSAVPVVLDEPNAILRGTDA